MVLQIKKLGLGTPEQVLSKAPEPPQQGAIDSALAVLREVGAFDDEGDLTALGKHLATFPLDVRAGKLLVLGSLLGCCSPAMTIAAAMSNKSPFLRNEAAERVTRAMAAPQGKCIAAGEESDPLVTLAAFDGFKAALRTGGRKEAVEYCNRKHLDLQALEMMDDMRSQFAMLLADNNLVLSSSKVRSRKEPLLAQIFPF